LELTVFENLKYTWHSQADESSIKAAIETFNLTKMTHTLARQLSQGQRQRIALARCLLSNAPLWILDEPLASIDQSGQVILETLLQHHLEQGGTAVVSTHRPLSSATLKMNTLVLPGETGQKSQGDAGV